jgi:hypothetical protein
MGPRWTDPATPWTRSPLAPPTTPPAAAAADQEREQERVLRPRHEGAEIVVEVEEAAVGVHRREGRGCASLSQMAAVEVHRGDARAHLGRRRRASASRTAAGTRELLPSAAVRQLLRLRRGHVSCAACGGDARAARTTAWMADWRASRMAAGSRELLPAAAAARGKLRRRREHWRVVPSSRRRAAGSLPGGGVVAPASHLGGLR